MKVEMVGYDWERRRSRARGYDVILFSEIQDGEDVGTIFVSVDRLAEFEAFVRQIREEVEG